MLHNPLLKEAIRVLWLLLASTGFRVEGLHLSNFRVGPAVIQNDVKCLLTPLYPACMEEVLTGGGWVALVGAAAVAMSVVAVRLWRW